MKNGSWTWNRQPESVVVPSGSEMKRYAGSLEAAGDGVVVDLGMSGELVDGGARLMGVYQVVDLGLREACRCSRTEFSPPQ